MGGTGLISGRGELIGIGSLQLEREREGKAEHVNMIVPIDLLKPVLDDIRKFGRVNKPARPWLGMYTTEIDNRVVVVGIASKGPAARAELKTSDVILAVNGDKITSQTGFYRKLWSLGAAGVDVPLTVYHEGVTFDVVLSSTDRAKLLKARQELALSEPPLTGEVANDPMRRPWWTTSWPCCRRCCNRWKPWVSSRATSIRRISTA